MASFINASSNHFLCSPSSSSSSHFIETHRSTFPSLPFLMTRSRRQQQQQLLLPQQSFPPVVDLVVSKRMCLGRLGSVGNSVLGFQRSSCSGSAQRMKSNGVWEDGDGDLDLESEVFEFMKKSENPHVFPTKKELIAAGRMDLVERIVKQGGWLSFGWDSDDEEIVQEDGVGTEDDYDYKAEMSSITEDGICDEWVNTDRRIFQQRFDGDGAGNGSVRSVGIGDSKISSSPCSSSGRWKEAGEDSGIAGILNRLQKERYQSLGLGSGETSRDDDQADQDLDVSKGPRHERSNKSVSRISKSDDSGGVHFQSGSLSDFDGTTNALKPDSWRTFSMERARLAEMKSEVDAIGQILAADDEMVTKTVSQTRNMRRKLNSGDKGKEWKDYSHIKSRLQQLEVDIASLLHGIRSRTNLAVSDKGNSSEELYTLSDISEFQETEIMNARDKLRSLRARMAILEGTMALASVEARKKAEVKQKRICSAQKALRLLRTVSIVWTNPASEVLLTGSFDGWTSQRRMEKESRGIFKLSLKLYPGKYEFKFIVDGTWMVDPLRPVVDNNGYQNNLVIIREY